MFQDNLPTQKRQHLPKIRRRSSAPSISFQRTVEPWLSELKAQGASDKSIVDRSGTLGRFVGWLENERQTEASLNALTSENVRFFLAYLREPQEHSRFGHSDTRSKRPARPSTCHTYYRDLKTLCRFCVTEGRLEAYPIENVKARRIPQDQLQALSPETIQELLNATRHSLCPERNCAIILCLLDSGLRLSELLSLRIGDVADAQQIFVTDKGNKRRKGYIGVACRRSLWRYRELERRDALPMEVVYVSIGGHRAGEALTRSGVGQIVKTAGQIAGLSGVRCSPHTLAIEFHRGGGDVFELQQLRGHESLEMVRRCVKKAKMDLEEAHRRASPADRLKWR